MTAAQLEFPSVEEVTALISIDPSNRSTVVAFLAALKAAVDEHGRCITANADLGLLEKARREG